MGDGFRRPQLLADHVEGFRHEPHPRPAFVLIVVRFERDGLKDQRHGPDRTRPEQGPELVYDELDGIEPFPALQPCGQRVLCVTVGEATGQIILHVAREERHAVRLFSEI